LIGHSYQLVDKSCADDNMQRRVFLLTESAVYAKRTKLLWFEGMQRNTKTSDDA